MTQRYKVSKCCWKNDTNRFICCKAIKNKTKKNNFQFVKNAIPVKQNKVKSEAM